ncbi:MAG: hypothetical protein RLZZ507_307 [Cyanobacteriota bacterium]|jgi:hypothetical protein
MGCLAIFLNLLFPGLGTLLFTNKKVAGFIQLLLCIINDILILGTLGIWLFFGLFIHIGFFAWALASTIGFMSERAAKKAIQEERERQG